MIIIDELVSSFTPISLEKMDEVKLLNRMDTKFVFGMKQLPPVMEQLHSSYYVLEINQVRHQRYENLYFDTPENLCYLNHHNKRMNRFKVRSRTYADSGLCFFEIKIKNNKERTRKERMLQTGPREEITGKAARLLTDCTGLAPVQLLPVIRIDFSRITLVNHRMTERITIDTGLKFSNEVEERSFPALVIAEVKQNRSCPSVFKNILHLEHIPEFRISKYCIGMVSLNNRIKHNNFKEKLHYINKLNHDIS
jgi:hypothetical protein